MGISWLIFFNGKFSTGIFYLIGWFYSGILKVGKSFVTSSLKGTSLTSGF